jgi:hypothetical protein
MDERSRSADTMQERTPGSTLKMWVLLEADRWLLAGILAALVPGTLLVVGSLAPTPLQTVLESKDPLETLFQAMIGATLTGVTLVVTISQLVLSQELGPAGDQHERMRGTVDFRGTVADHLAESVSPAEPAAFLRSLVDAVAQNAERLAAETTSGTSAEVRTEVTEFTSSVRANAESVTERLASAEFGTFRALSAALDFNYSGKLYEARRLRSDHEDRLSAGGTDALDELVTTLELFAPAREHVKTLYFQWELINLSRAVLYAAIPSFLTAGAMILFVDGPASLPGVTAGIPNVLLVTSLAIGVTILPFTLLFSYMLRIGTVAKRTLAIGPFVLRDQGSTDADGPE